MTALLLYTIKVSAVLAAGMLASALLRRRSAALRHSVLGTAIALALILPALQMVLPAWDMKWPARSTSQPLEFVPVETGVAGPPDIVARARPRNTAGEARAFITRWMVPVWLAGAFVSLGVLLLAIVRLREIERQATRVTDGAWARDIGVVAREYGLRPPALLQTSQPALLVTWGWRRPRVLLPAGASAWPEPRVRLVLRHELAHVQRGDWMAQMAAELLRSVNWFNPLAWIACRQLRQESEQACDDRVLLSGADASMYATELLDLARAFGGQARAWPMVPAAARPSTLQRRIRAMLTHDRDRRPASGWLRSLAAVALLVVTMGVAGFELAAGTQSPQITVVPPAARPVAPADLPSAAAPTAETPDARPVTTAPAPVRPRPALERTRERAGRPVQAADPIPVTTLAQPATPAPAVITGTVVDVTGGRLPGVRVALERSVGAQREVRSTTTDATGGFRLIDLPAGDYELQVSLPGFATLVQQVSVDAERSGHHELTLPVGSVREAITVGSGTATSAMGWQLERAAELIQEAAARAYRDSTPEAVIPEIVPGRPVRVGGAIAAPRKLKDARPLHPGESGVVVLQARIGPAGVIESVEPLRSPSEALTAAASAAVWQWEFTPARLNGRPIAVDMFVTVTFTEQP